jgi:hypothetical protein
MRVDRAVSAYTGFNVAKELRTRVVPVLESHDVRLAYLFGSHARGEVTKLSDVDLAVSFAAGVDVRKAQGELLDALVLELKTDRIDLVLLEEIPPPLAFRIIRDGERLVVRDPRENVSFRTRTIMRYLDFKPLRDAAFVPGVKRFWRQTDGPGLGDRPRSCPPRPALLKELDGFSSVGKPARLQDPHLVRAR